MKSFKSFIVEEETPKEGGNGKKISVGKSTVKINPNSEELKEVAPPGAEYERLIKNIKKSYSKGGLTDKEKSIAYATAWKQKNQDTQESAVPGQPAERLGAVTAIPSDEREAAKQRTLAKAAALRKKREEQKEEVEHLDEAEGSYGQTPKARQKMGDLANKRRNTPASEYSERGEKKKKVDTASKHFNRMGNPDAGDRSKKSTKPDWNSGKRRGMTQSDRDHARGEAEYGHTGYDPDWNGPASGPGGKPKGKKAERQKQTGVSAESFNMFEIEEGMTMKDFKANRQKNKRRAASADAEKRGHVGKEWYNSGRKYSPDEAKRSRANMDDEERRTRHRSAVDPDNENDDNFSADKTKNPKKLRKQKAMGELG